MRFPLRFQILVLLASTMLATLIAVSLLTAYVAARQREQEIERQVRGVAQILLESNFPLTDAVLKQMHLLAGAEFVLTDQAGQPRATSGPRAEKLTASTASTVEATTTSRQPITEIEGKPYFHTTITLLRPATQAQPQWLHVLYPEQSWRDARFAAAMPPLVVGAGGMLVISGLAMLVARRMSRPITSLEQGVGRLAAGDFEPIPLPARDDELRDLVGRVNALACQLEEYSRVIRRTERLALLGQLAGGMAHELRNGLSAAGMAVELHQRQCHTDRESLAMALEQLTLLASQLQRFLAVGRPPELRQEWTDLSVVVQQAVELVEPTCRHRKLRCDVALPVEPLSTWADAEQLRQLLLNLLVNAIDASDRGGWVRVEGTRLAEGIQLAVLDNGPGPPEALWPTLFEPFVTGKPEGVGLGLAVARQVAEAHGGTLRFAPRVGVTCFELVIPDSNRSRAIAPSSEHATPSGGDVASRRAYSLSAVSDQGIDARTQPLSNPSTV